MKRIPFPQPLRRRARALAIAGILAAWTGAAATLHAGMIVHYNGEEASPGPLVDQVGGQTASPAGTGHLYRQAGVPRGAYGAIGLTGGSGQALGISETGTGSWNLDLSESAELGSLVNNFTVMAWVYLPVAGVGDDWPRVIGDNAAWDGDGWNFGITNKGGRSNAVALTGNGILSYYSAQNVVRNGAWQHIAATKSSTGGIKLYVNGIRVANEADYSGATGNFIASNDIWGVGEANDVGPDTNISGMLIDELRVYDEALDATGIIAAAGGLPAFSLNPQDLYTQTGTDPTMAELIASGIIVPGEGGGFAPGPVYGSQIDVNNALLEQQTGRLGPIPQDFSIHTEVNSQVGRAAFPKFTRWYQEDGDIQVFRLFKGDQNVRNADPARWSPGRIEAHTPAIKVAPGTWREWEATYTMIKPGPCTIFQLFHDGGQLWAFHLGMNSAGDITFNRRRDVAGLPKNITLATNMVGKSLSVKVRANGYDYELYKKIPQVDADWTLVTTGSYQQAVNNDIRFRWGMYFGSVEGASVPTDSLLLVSGVYMTTWTPPDPLTGITIGPLVENYNESTTATTNVLRGFRVPDGNDRKLILAASWESSNSAISATWMGDELLTQAVKKTNGRVSAILYLDNPTPGFSDIVVTYGAATASRIGAVSVTGLAPGVHRTASNTGKTGTLTTTLPALVLGAYTNNWASGNPAGITGPFDRVLYNGESGSSLSDAGMSIEAVPGTLTYTWAASSLSDVNALAAFASSRHQLSFYDQWVAAHATELGPDTDFHADPDGDGLCNGLEAWFGSRPDLPSPGLVPGQAAGNVFTFTHPVDPAAAAAMNGFYEWSPDLAQWYPCDGATGPAGGPTVSADAQAAGGSVTVTATASGTMRTLFLRAAVTP